MTMNQSLTGKNKTNHGSNSNSNHFVKTTFVHQSGGEKEESVNLHEEIKEYDEYSRKVREHHMSEEESVEGSGIDL